MTRNIFPRPAIGGALTLGGVSEREIETKKLEALEQERIDKEAELEAAKDEYFDKGRSEATIEFTQMVEETKKTAYEEGYINGRTDATEELNPKYEAMKAIFDQWDIEKANFLKEMEQDALELSLALEKKIVGYEIQKNSEPLKHAIAESLKMIRDRKKLVVRVSRDDEEYFNQGALEFVKTLGEDIEVVPDVSVAQGGCVVETSMGNVDATLETRWTKIIEMFFAGIERGDNDILSDMLSETQEHESDAVCGEGDEDSGPVG